MMKKKKAIFAKKKSNCAEQRSPINTIIGVGINYASEFRPWSYRFPSGQMLFQRWWKSNIALKLKAICL